MSAKTKIEWTDRSWSPLKVRLRKDAPRIARDKGYTSLIQIVDKIAERVATGKHSGVGHHCENVSPACDNCYAEANNRRCLPGNGTGLPYDRRSRDLVEPFVDERELMGPFKWREPQNVFVENQSDLFAEWYTEEMRQRVFGTMAHCPQHTFQVLTKRATALREWWRPLGQSGWPNSWPLPNVWLGVTTEDERRAKERIVDLMASPAAVRFLSCEPLLGPLNLYSIDRCMDDNEPTREQLDGEFGFTYVRHGAPFIDWVICGGESGRGARHMDLAWARDLREQCARAGVPFFMKQITDALGRKVPFEQWPADLQVREFPGAKP